MDDILLLKRKVERQKNERTKEQDKFNRTKSGGAYLKGDVSGPGVPETVLRG